MAQTEDGDNALLARGGGGLPGPVLVNPLAAITAGNQAAQAEFTTRGWQAKEAAGQAYQGAINPQTGEFDPNEFRRRLAASGPAAMEAGAALLNTQNISSNQFEQNRAKAQWASSRAATLTRLGPNITEQAAIDVLQEGLRTGVLTQPEFDRQSAEVRSLGGNPAKLNSWANQHEFNAMSMEQQLPQKYGTTGTEVGPDGRRIGTVQQPARAGGGVSAPPQAGVPLGLSPESTAAHQQWLKSPREYPDPANPTVTKHGTNETFLKDSGVPDQFIYVGGAPATPGTQPGAASPLGTGRPPAPLLNPNKPQGTPAATPTPSPAGTGISGPTPAQTATANATAEVGKLSPPKFQAESDADTLAQNQQAILANMLVDTSQFTTGPLAGIIGKVRNYAGNIGLNINTDAQSAKESFGKLAAGIAVSQAQAVGAGSDTRFNVVSAANPHDELSPAGVDLILRQLQGNADYIRARASLAAKHPDKANYPAFQESIKELDPRVFQLSRMTQPQRDTYWKNLKDTEQTQLGAAIKKAKEMGVLGG